MIFGELPGQPPGMVFYGGVILADMHRVIVRVTGSQRGLDGEDDTINMLAEGRHYSRNGIHYVLYDDRSLTKGQKTATVLKIGADTLTLVRQGAVTHRMEFDMARESRSHYRTPFGSLELGCQTRRLDIDYGTVSGTVDVDYALAVNGRPQSENTLHIEIATAPEDRHRLN